MPEPDPPLRIVQQARVATGGPAADFLGDVLAPTPCFATPCRGQDGRTEGHGQGEAGRMTDDRDLEAEGKRDKAKADIKRGVDDAADSVKRGVDKVTP